MNFTNKETYLAAVVEWKTQYAALSTEIRITKQAFKESASIFSKTPYNQRSVNWSAMERLRASIHKLISQANSMLAERKQGKIVAQQQYLLEKASK